MPFSLYEDVNECSGSPCHVNATCENRDGTFRCYCKPGFTGDGYTCQGNCR